MSTEAHIVVSVVTVSVLLLVAMLLRRRELQAKYAVLWLSLGVGMALLALSPALLDRVSLLLGIAYGPTTLFLAATVLLFVLSMHYSMALSRLEERTRVLAEELAILRAGEPPPEPGPGTPAARRGGDGPGR